MAAHEPLQSCLGGARCRVAQHWEGPAGTTVHVDEDGFFDIREPLGDEEEADEVQRVSDRRTEGSFKGSQPVSETVAAASDAKCGTPTATEDRTDVLRQLRELERLEELQELDELDKLVAQYEDGVASGSCATSAAADGGDGPPGQQQVFSPADLFAEMRRAEEAAREPSPASLGPMAMDRATAAIAGWDVREHLPSDAPQPRVPMAATEEAEPGAVARPTSRFKSERQRSRQAGSG